MESSRTCCCCFSQQTGTVIIGVVHLVLFLYNFFGSPGGPAAKSINVVFLLAGFLLLFGAVQVLSISIDCLSSF